MTDTEILDWLEERVGSISLRTVMEGRMNKSCQWLFPDIPGWLFRPDHLTIRERVRKAAEEEKAREDLLPAEEVQG